MKKHEMNARGKVGMQIYNDASLFACLTLIKLFILINIFILLDTNNQSRIERTLRCFDREAWTRKKNYGLESKHLL